MNAEVPEALLQREVEAICQRYKIAPEHARQIVLTSFAETPKLLQTIQQKHPQQDVTRLKAYQRAVKTARKRVYYALRQYRHDNEQIEDLRTQLLNATSLQDARPIVEKLLQNHVSTQERLPHYVDFYAQLAPSIDESTTVIDVGCGMHPLSLPFYATITPAHYIAIDRDHEAMQTLEALPSALQNPRISCHTIDLENLDWAVVITSERQNNFALMLKVVPVVARQTPELCEKLTQVPAQKMLVTASKEAMTRYEDISRREERLLRQFIAGSGRSIIAEFHIENEFGYVLE